MGGKFGDAFRKERKRSEKTIGDLARALGVSITYLSDVERNERPPLNSERIAAACVCMRTDPLVQRSLNLLAQAQANGISLPLPASEAGRELGAALQRRWSNLGDDEVARIMSIINSDSKKR